MHTQARGRGDAIRCQRNRRNMTDAELMHWVKVVDKRRRQGEDQEREGGKFLPKGPNKPIGKSAEKTAKIVGTSASKVKKIRKRSGERTDLKPGNLGSSEPRSAETTAEIVGTSARQVEWVRKVLVHLNQFSGAN